MEAAVYVGIDVSKAQIIVSTKFPNLIEVSKMLRSDPATGWESIVAQSAEWIESDAAQRVSWEKAERDLSVLLPAVSVNDWAEFY